MISFAVEPLSEIWEEKELCGLDHWKELELDKDGSQLNRSLERYEAVEKIGLYIEIVARVDGEIAGFFGMYVLPSMVTSETIASEDGWYLKPKFRGGRNALKFYRFAEEEAKRRGAKRLYFSIPTVSTVGRFLERQGCKVESTIYEKIF